MDAAEAGARGLPDTGDFAARLAAIGSALRGEQEEQEEQEEEQEVVIQPGGEDQEVVTDNVEGHKEEEEEQEVVSSPRDTIREVKDSFALCLKRGSREENTREGEDVEEKEEMKKMEQDWDEEGETEETEQEEEGTVSHKQCEGSRSGGNAGIDGQAETKEMEPK